MVVPCSTFDYDVMYSFWWEPKASNASGVQPQETVIQEAGDKLFLLVGPRHHSKLPVTHSGHACCLLHLVFAFAPWQDIQQRG